MINKNFHVLFGLINPNNIFNLCGPDMFGPYGDKEYEINERNKKANVIISKRNNRDQFYSKLEKNILKEGFKNPIIIYNSLKLLKNPKLPNNLKKSFFKNKLVCFNHGGSRLYIAQKYNIPIPCIIIDHENKLKNIFTELNSIEEIYYQYIDKPEKIMVTDEGVFIFNLPQSQNN